LITFKTVKWRNLLSTGAEWTEIDLLAHNTTLIIGHNGAGKSTVLDALTFALFNKPFRKIKKPQMLNTINLKNMMVEVTFSVGSIFYMVRRGMKPAVFEIWKNGKMLDQDAKIGDYQYVLEKTILKLNYKSFTQIVVLGNSSFVPFMQLSTGARREVIEDLLDIQIFSLMNGLLKERISSNKQDRLSTENAIDLTEEKIDVQEGYIETLKSNNADNITNIETEIKGTLVAINAHQVSIGELTTKASQLMASITDEQPNKKSITELGKIEDQITQRLRRHKKAISFFEDNDTCPTCEQGIEEDFKTAHVDAREKKVVEIAAGLTQLEAKLESMEARREEIHAVNQEVAQYNTTIMVENNNVTSLNTYVKKLNKDIDALREVKDDWHEEEKKLNKHQKDLVVNESRRTELIMEKSIFDLASTLLKDGGVKTRIIRQYVPIMNKLINKYLAALDFFVGFELDEQFNEVIRSRNRDEFSYASFSEGEKQRIDLSLLFTWRAVARMKNSVSTNLLMLDEIFDSSLDPAGCDEFMKLLHDLGASANVFVISHKGDVLQDKFENTIRFEKHKNFSRIVE
jgi:DNA repair exonuclease SbcCD ATPase subunit